MGNGINTIICIIAVVLFIIAERGIPVKLNKRDGILYIVLGLIFKFISEYFK